VQAGLRRECKTKTATEGDGKKEKKEPSRAERKTNVDPEKTGKRGKPSSGREKASAPETTRTNRERNRLEIERDS